MIAAVPRNCGFFIALRGRAIQPVKAVNDKLSLYQVYGFLFALSVKSGLPHKTEERKMYADGYDYRTAAGLHRDRLNEAESIRRAKAAMKAAAETEQMRRAAVGYSAKKLRYRIGIRLIAIGEKMTA